MGFIKKLMKKKPGGTFFGNLLRTGASMATNGMLGNGANMIPLDAPQASGGAPQVAPEPKSDKLAEALNSFLTKSTKDVTIQGAIDPNTKWYIGGLIAGVLLIVLVTKKK